MIPPAVSNHANDARLSTNASTGRPAPTTRFPLSKQQRLLKPLPRRQPGSVYSKKMTVGCKPSSLTRKMRSKKKRAGTAAGNHGVGQPPVRLMLPWWHHSVPKLSAGSKEADATSREREAGDGTDAALYSTPKSAAGVEAQPPKQQSTRPAMPESTQTHPEKENVQRGKPDSGSGMVNFKISGKQIKIEKPDDEEQKGTNEYTHYTNLFENPPPSIPTVDQYISDDNILYEAITKRGQRKALPLNPSGGGVFEIQECGDPQWAAAGVASNGVDELEIYVDPQDLLYADEDVEKVSYANGRS